MNNYFRPYINNQDREENWGRPRLRTSDNHHIAPSSRTYNWKDWPTIELYQTIHRAYHRLFWNAIFQEAIEQLLKINWFILTERYKKDIQEVMNMNDDYVYKNWVRIKK